MQVKITERSHSKLFNGDWFEYQLCASKQSSNWKFFMHCNWQQDEVKWCCTLESVEIDFNVEWDWKIVVKEFEEEESVDWELYSSVELLE